MATKKDLIAQLDRDLESIIGSVFPPAYSGHIHSGLSPDFEGVLRLVCTYGVEFIHPDELFDNPKVKMVEIIVHDEKYLNVVYAKGMQEKPLNHKDGFFLYPINNYNAMIGHVEQYFVNDKMPLANFEADPSTLH